MNRIVLDTSVLIAARRSPTGASNALLRRVGMRQIEMLATVTLFVEYEAVMVRPEQLAAMRTTASEVARFLDVLAGLVVPVRVNYLWRPQLTDPADEMVLEAAANGRADAITSFNLRHLAPAGIRFGLEVLTPADVLRRIP